MRTLVLPAALTAALLLGGCAGDETSAADDPAATAGEPAAGEPTTAPEGSPTPEELEPSVTPVDGKPMVISTARVRAPKGWKVEEVITDYLDALDPWSVSSVGLMEIPFYSDLDVDQVARNALQSAPPKVRRLPNTTVDGLGVYHFAGWENDVRWLEEFGRMHNGQGVTIKIRMDRTKYRDKASRDEFVQSVLATLEWY